MNKVCKALITFIIIPSLLIQSCPALAAFPPPPIIVPSQSQLQGLVPPTAELYSRIAVNERFADDTLREALGLYGESISLHIQTEVINKLKDYLSNFNISSHAKISQLGKEHNSNVEERDSLQSRIKLYTYIQYIVLPVVVIGFLISMFGLSLRFGMHLKIPELRALAHWSEHTRVGTDLIGYFIIPCIVAAYSIYFSTKSTVYQIDFSRLIELKKVTQEYNPTKLHLERYQTEQIIGSHLKTFKDYFRLVEFFNILRPETPISEEFVDRIWLALNNLHPWLQVVPDFQNGLFSSLISKKIKIRDALKSELNSSRFDHIKKELMAEFKQKLLADANLKGRRVRGQICKILVSNPQASDLFYSAMCKAATEDFDGSTCNVFKKSNLTIDQLPQSFKQLIEKDSLSLLGQTFDLSQLANQMLNLLITDPRLNSIFYEDFMPSISTQTTRQVQFILP